MAEGCGACQLRFTGGRRKLRKTRKSKKSVRKTRRVRKH